MKAILIDVKNEEIKEVEFDGTLHNIYDLVDCATFDVVRIDETNGIYVDDEGLFVEDQLFFIRSQRWWRNYISNINFRRSTRSNRLSTKRI
jgi:hypothetical protein